MRQRAARVSWLKKNELGDIQTDFMLFRANSFRVLLAKETYEGMGKPRALEVVVIADSKGILKTNG